MHDVELDYAGFSCRPRLTCHTCGVTLLKQPYMSLKVWVSKVSDFENEHPSEILTAYKNLVQPTVN